LDFHIKAKRIIEAADYQVVEYVWSAKHTGAFADGTVATDKVAPARRAAHPLQGERPRRQGVVVPGLAERAPAPRYHTGDRIALGQQVFGQVAAVLTCDAGDQRALRYMRNTRR